MNESGEDAHWMRRALRLAAKGEGSTFPNPPVGAVVVAGGKVIGEGYHAGAGGPHAEVVALDACGKRARGAVLYVTLEPCCTHGKTPPCTKRILESGLRRVVYAVDDPNPRHAGRAYGLLANAGVEVHRGVCQEPARSLLAPFSKRMITGMPYLTLKMAMSLDGCIADRTGRSKWITGPHARNAVQRLRKRHDVVAVGAGTVVADDPSLLCRLGKSPAGVRLVVGDGRPLSPKLRIFSDGASSSTIIGLSETSGITHRADLEKAGARVWTFPDVEGNSRHFDLAALMHRLGKEGFLSVLCEGGAGLAGALIHAGLVDEYVFFVAPCLLGDRKALPVVSGLGRLLEMGERMRFHTVRRVGDDLMVRAFPDKKECEKNRNRNLCLQD